MTGPTHLSAGILAAVIHWMITGELQLDGIILGALIPDIDDKDSTIGKCCTIISGPISWIQKGTRIIDHRMITHSIIPIAGLAYWYTVSGHKIIYGIIVGIISHIAADMLNDRGVALLYPISDFRIRFASITTGKEWESRINFLIWIVIICMLLPDKYFISILDQIVSLINFIKDVI